MGPAFGPSGEGRCGPFEALLATARQPGLQRVPLGRAASGLSASSPGRVPRVVVVGAAPLGLRAGPGRLQRPSVSASQLCGRAEMLPSAGLAGGGEDGSCPHPLSFVPGSPARWAMRAPLLPVSRDRRISDFPMVSKKRPSSPPWLGGGALCPGGGRNGSPLPAWAL